MKFLHLLITLFYVISCASLQAQEQNPLDAVEFHKGQTFIEKSNAENIQWNKLLVIHDDSVAEIDKDFLAPKNRYFWAGDKHELMSLQDVKKKNGKNALTDNQSILEIMTKSNASLMLLINQRDETILEGYLYEGIYGNCILYRTITLTKNNYALRDLSHIFRDHVSFYKKKIEGGKAPLFIKSGSHVKDLLNMSHFARYAAYTHFLLSTNPDAMLLLEEDDKEKFIYCTNSFGNNFIYLTKSTEKNKIIKITYFKNGGLHTFEPEKKDSLKHTYDDIANNLMVAYDLSTSHVTSDRDGQEFIERLPGVYKAYVIRESIGYYVSPFEPRRKTAFRELLTEDKLRECLWLSDKNIIDFDKFDLELNKIDYLEESLESARSKQGSIRDIDFLAIFVTNEFTEAQKNQLSSTKINFQKEYIDILIGKDGNNFIGFRKLGLESTEAITEMFDLFYDSYQKKDFSLQAKKQLIENYFDAIANPPRYSSNLRTNERELRQEIIYSYLKDKDELKAFVSTSAKIRNYRLRNLPSNPTKEQIDSEKQIQIQLEKDIKIYKPMLIKFFDVTREFDFRFLYRLDNQNLSDGIADEFMNTIRKNWVSKKKFSNNDLYIYLLESKLNVLFTAPTRERSDASMVNTLKGQFKLLSDCINSFTEENLFSEYKDIFSLLLGTISRIKISDSARHQIYIDYANTILMSGIKSKVKDKRFIDLLKAYIVEASKRSHEDNSIKICKDILSYLDSEKAFFANGISRQVTMNHIDKMILNNKNQKSELITPDVLKYELVLSKDKVITDLKLNFGPKFNATKLLNGIAYNNQEIAYLYYQTSKNDTNLSFFLVKYSLDNGRSTIIKKFDATSLIERHAKEGKSSVSFSSSNNQKTAFFKNEFYIIYQGELIRFDHKTGSCTVTDIKDFENQTILNINGFNNKLFIFSEDKNKIETKENVFGYYDIDTKVFKHILKNDESGSNGLINSNTFNVYNVYQYNNNYYVNLRSKVTGSKDFSHRICQLDLLKGEHTIVSVLENESSSLHFSKNKILYFRNSDYYVKDLKSKRDFVQHPKSWPTNQGVIMLDTGVIFTHEFNGESILHYYDFDSKETQVNLNGHVRIYNVSMPFNTNQGLLIFEYNESVILFPNIKED